MDEGTLTRKTKAIINTYLKQQDLKETKKSCKEMRPLDMHVFVNTAIQHVLELSSKARHLTGTLLYYLLKNHVISRHQYLHGLSQIIEFAEDMEPHMPEIWEWLGELIGPMVQDGSIHMSFLKDAFESLIVPNKAGILVAEVLKDASRRMGHQEIGKKFKKSGLTWSDFMDEEDIAEFVAKHKLEYTIDSNQPPESDTSVGDSLSEEAMQKQLEGLIGLNDMHFDSNLVMTWTMDNEFNTKKPAFVRALVKAVCTSAITKLSDDETILDVSSMKERTNLLIKYLNHNCAMELQALYAIQALVTKLKHPAGLLRSLFDVLYDTDVIGEDAFIQWQTSDDPAEGAGRLVCRAATTQFFVWLREPGNDDFLSADY